MALTLSADRLTLRPFELSDLHDFRELHADPNVMRDLGGPIDGRAARQKLERYMAAFKARGYGRMAVFHGGAFAGYVGVQRLAEPDHPLGPHDEIGWRIRRAAWGRGIATRAAKLCLDDAFARGDLPHVLAYTGADNLRSQAVMARLGMTRRPDLDFKEHYPPVGTWHGMTWRIEAPNSPC